MGRRWTGGRVAGVVGTAVVALLVLTSCGLLPGSDDSSDTTAPHKAALPAQLENFRTSHPEWLTRNHVTGPISYPMSPPVGGPHNPVWQDCMGEVYPQPIANEHAVHSLEHGAVWVTYRPDLPADQIKELAAQVTDRPFMMMSPYPSLDRPISLQAWGYRLQVDSADDPAILTFIRAYRIKATLEPQAGCSGGVTDSAANTKLT